MSLVVMQPWRSLLAHSWFHAGPAEADVTLQQAPFFLWTFADAASENKTLSD